MVKHIAIGAEGLGFNYQAGQTGHVSPTARYRCDVSSKLCCLGAKPRILAPPFAIRFGVYREYYEDLIWIFDPCT